MPFGALRRMSRDVFSRDGSARHGRISETVLKARRSEDAIDLDTSKHELGHELGPGQQLPQRPTTAPGRAEGVADSPVASDTATSLIESSPDASQSITEASNASSSSSPRFVSNLPSNRTRDENAVSPSLVRGADASFIYEAVRTIQLSELGHQDSWKLLGSGEFCSAFLTTLDGVQVVVKMLKPEQRKNRTAAADLQSETYLMCSMRCVPPTRPRPLGLPAQQKSPPPPLRSPRFVRFLSPPLPSTPPTPSLSWRAITSSRQQAKTKTVSAGSLICACCAELRTSYDESSYSD